VIAGYVCGVRMEEGKVGMRRKPSQICTQGPFERVCVEKALQYTAENTVTTAKRKSVNFAADQLTGHFRPSTRSTPTSIPPPPTLIRPSTATVSTWVYSQRTSNAASLFLFAECSARLLASPPLQCSVTGQPLVLGAFPLLNAKKASFP